MKYIRHFNKWWFSRSYFQQYAIGLSIVVLCIGALYTAFRFSPLNHRIDVKFAVNDVLDNNDGFYFLEKNIEGERISSTDVEGDEEGYRDILRPTAYATIHGKKYPADIQRLSFDTRIDVPDANLDVQVLCSSECTRELPKLPLYINGIEDYQHQYDFRNDTYVYSPAAVSAPSSFQSVEEWMLEQNSRSFYVTQETWSQLDKTQFVDMPNGNIRETDYAVDTILFPNQELYVQASESFHVQFTKRNFNSRQGRDSMIVHVRDVNGTIVDERTLLDDGVTSGTSARTEQDFDYTFTLPGSGVYVLDFSVVDNDDFVIQNLTMNTDKVSFSSARLRQAGSIYTALREPTSIILAAENRSPSGVVKVENILTGVQTEYEWRTVPISNTMVIPLEAGEYRIEVDNTVDIQNGMFSFSSDVIFQPFSVDMHLAMPSIEDVVVTRLQVSKNNDGTLRVQNHFVNDDFTYWTPPAIEEIDVDNINDLSLEFSVHLQGERAFENAEIMDIAQLTDEWCGMSLFSTTQLLEEDVPEHEEGCSVENTKNHLSNLLPEFSSIDIHTQYFQYADLVQIEGVEDYSGDPGQYVETHVRGDSQFAFYAQGDWSAKIHKVDLNRAAGPDEVRVRVVSSAGEILYSETIDDDGNRTDNKIHSDKYHEIQLNGLDGVYFLHFDELPLDRADDDFMIADIEMNTNKLMLLSDAVFIEPTDVYFDQQRTREVVFRLPNKRSSTNPITIALQNLERDRVKSLEFSSNSKRRAISIDPGLYYLQTIEPQVQMYGPDLAFRPDGAFRFIPYENGEDYILTDAFNQSHVRLHEMTIDYQ